MDDKGTIRRLAALVVAMDQAARGVRPMLRESRRLSTAPTHSASPTVGNAGAFGGLGRRTRLGDGQLDPSTACAKAGRRGGKANPKFGTRVGERG